jgi:hypothetical protein
MREAVAIRLGTPVGRLILKEKNSRNSRPAWPRSPKRLNGPESTVRHADTTFTQTRVS